MGLEYVSPISYDEETVTTTTWDDECIWKTYTWEAGEDTEYRDDIDEVSPDDSGLLDFP